MPERQPEQHDNALRASNPIAPANAHIDAPLSDFAASYSPGTFIADAVCPPILVDQRSDKFFKRFRKDVTTEVYNRVGDRGALQESTYDVTTDSYYCVGYGLKGPVPRSLQAIADAPLNPMQFATQDVQVRNLLSREIRVADMITTSGNWASSNTGAASAVWTNTTTGAPLDDIHTALEAVPATGQDSMLVGVCALEVFNALRRHPQIRDLHGNGQGQINAAVLAEYLGLDMLYVSDVQKNTANTGLTASYSRVWLNTVFAIVRRPRQLVSTQQEVFGVTFRRRIAGSANGWLTRTWHDANEGTEGTDFVAVTHEDDEKVVQNDQGYLITGVRS